MYLFVLDLLSLRLIPCMFLTLLHTSSAPQSAPVGLVLASALHSAFVGLVPSSALPSSDLPSSDLPSSALPLDDFAR